MDRAQNTLAGGFSGMVQTISSSIPNFGDGGQLSALEMLFKTSAEVGKGIKQEFNNSEWSVKE